jgi:hypothetical protein
LKSQNPPLSPASIPTIFQDAFLGYATTDTLPVLSLRWLTQDTDNSEDHYEQVYNNDNFDENKSSFGHEVLAGGAAFAGFKAFEDHQRNEGS